MQQPSSPATAAGGSPPAPEQSRPGVPSAPAAGGLGPRRVGGQTPPVWAQRVLLGLEVSIAVWTGILVLVLPWTRLWTENPLLGTLPGLKLILNFTFIRGMISGVGIVDIWMGVADALHYRDLR